MALSWSSRRKFTYLLAAGVVALILLVAGYETFLTAPPTCFDGTQNAGETGVDCGGSCALVCPNVAHAPIVLWARAFQTAPGVYTAASYVQNNNVGAGARAVPYSFQLFDENNQLVVERDGVMDLPPSEVIPVVEPNISSGNRSVSRALFAFGSAPVWNKVPTGRVVPLITTGQQLSEDGSRLSATVVNNSTMDAPRFTVAAVLFDQEGIARGASKSIVPSLAHKSSQPVVFTWPTGVPNIVRAEITVLPSF